MPATPIEDRLQAVHAHYRERIDVAVAAGRMDVVDELVCACEDEALALILKSEGAAEPRHVEVLDVGGWWPQWRPGRRTARTRRRLPRPGNC